MWGVAKIFASGHSKEGFDRTPRTNPGYGYDIYFVIRNNAHTIYIAMLLTVMEDV